MDTISNVETGISGPTGEVWERAKAERNWLLFLLQTEVRDGKEKLAKKPTLDGCTVVDRQEAARHTFDDAMAAACAQNMLADVTSGKPGSVILGYFPRPGAAMYGLDFDNCLDPKTGEVTDANVAQILGTAESYTEISPSGTGLRIWIATPSDGRAIKRRVAHLPRRAGMETSGIGGNAFTFTGRQFPGAPNQITPAPRSFDAVMKAAEESRSASVAESRGAWDCPLEDIHPDDVRAKLSKALDDDQTLSRRWAGVLDGMSDQSRSAVDLAIIGLLKRNGFSFSEVVHCMLAEYSGESRAADNWRDGNERDMRRCFGRSGGPTAEEEFEPVKLGAPGTIDWIEHDERATADLEEFWRVDELLPFEGMGVLYGPPGCGKTFLALDLGLSVATGRQWMDQAVEQCAVVYVASEGGRRAARNRIVGWQYETGVFDTPAFECASANFALPASAAPLIAAIKDRGVMPGLVIVDTLNQNFGGGDENSAQDMGQFVTQVKKIQRDLGCFVLVLHHSGKDASRGARGHSTLLGAVDFEATIETGNSADGTTTRSFKVTKNRDGLSGHAIGFRLKRVALGQSTKGKEVTTCVALATGSRSAQARAAAEGRKKAVAGRSAQQVRALEILERHESLVLDFSEHVSRWSFADWVQEYIREVRKNSSWGLPVPSRSNATAALRNLIDKGVPAAHYVDGDRVAPLYVPGSGAQFNAAEPDDAAD